MCIALFSLNHPVYSLVLCSNRDEFLSRPTLQAHFHSFDRGITNGVSAPFNNHGDILSGRDVAAGGTWIGVNRGGRVAVLTNITEAPGQYDTSRGDLPAGFLQPPDLTSLEEYADYLCSPPPKKYAGFNLLLLAPSAEPPSSLNAVRVTNSGGGGPITYRSLYEDERQCGGMSNGVDGHEDGEWPKVTAGRTGLRQILEKGLSEDDLISALFDLLTQCPGPPQTRQELRTSVMIPPLLVAANAPRPPPADGSQPNAPASASSGAWYGTRLSTVVLINKSGEVVFIERDMWKLDDDDGKPIRAPTESDRAIRFHLDSRSF